MPCMPLLLACTQTVYCQLCRTVCDLSSGIVLQEVMCSLIDPQMYIHVVQRVRETAYHAQ